MKLLNMIKQSFNRPVSAKKYFDKELGVYRFPFKVLDDTPGGSNLGRIEWLIELVRAKKKDGGLFYIEKLYIWARQTRDKRYIEKSFEIPCYVESIFCNSLDNKSFFKGVWKVVYCSEHGNVVLVAYPDNNDFKALHIRVSSSVGIDIEFVKE